MNTTSPVKNGFTRIQQSSADTVFSAAFNPTGTRIALASADHKIRVYDLGYGKVWNLVDQWRGHDGEVSQVQWIGPALGQLFGTIGGDNKFKLWREDPSQTPKGGRRFKCIYSQSPSNHLPYVALDMKTVKSEVWIVLMTHDGCINLLEPYEPESLTAWKETDSIYPFGQQPRSAEPRYRLSFHQAERPCYDAIEAGLDVNTLSLAVSGTNIVKIFRALKSDDSGYQFHEVLEIATSATLINDLAWAPGCIRPYDLVAAACDDGLVRIFKITTPHEVDFTAGDRPSNIMAGRRRHSYLTPRNARSGIGAGLAGASRAGARNSISTPRIKHEYEEVATMQPEGSRPVWKVRWMHDGNALVSTGDSGKAHLWRRDLNGDFLEFAETGRL